jgi:hypothetical protein
MNASTKRTPTAVLGKVGAAVTNIASLALAYAPVPFDDENIERYKFKSPRKAFITGVFGVVDVLEGDILTANNIDYHVRAVGSFSGTPVEFTEILMEKVI